MSEDSIIEFKNPVPQPIADALILRISEELLPLLMDIDPDYSLEPIFNEDKELIAVNFLHPLNPSLKKEAKLKIREILDSILKEFREKGLSSRTRGEFGAFGEGPDIIEQHLTQSGAGQEHPIGFTELLGTYRVSVNRVYIPILITIFSAIFLAYLTRYRADLELNAALVDPNESSTVGIILNGLVPVLISALFITLIWLAVKKYGLKVFKYIMGIIVLFYDWYGFILYVEVGFFIISDWINAQSEPTIIFFLILFHTLHWGTLIYVIYLGVQFFKGNLSTPMKNLLVLLFGIFLGALVGISFPTWTTISFAIFLSIWDIITVFKGPLGKIADLVMQNRGEVQQVLEEKIRAGELTPEEAMQLGYSPLAHQEELNFKSLRPLLKQIKIEIGSGDLIMYSALVAHVYIVTQNWLITLCTLIGVLFGMALTMYYLFMKKRVLPALPFSMLFGIVIFISMAIPMGYL